MAAPDIRSLDVAMLRTFDALMRERSVSRAAKRLFLSQPAVSASLSRLRTAFGDPLFTRTAHGVVPTARAHALAPQVERLLADLSRLLEADHGFEPADSQRIFRIAGTDYASLWILPPLARHLAAVGSRIRLFWEPVPISAMYDRLRKGDLDIAVVPRLKPPGDVQSVALYEDRYVVAVRRTHPLFACGATLDALCAVPHVFFGYGSSSLDDLIDEELARAGRQRLAQLAVTTFAQVIELLACTDHAAIMPMRIAQRHSQLIEAHDPPFVLPNYSVYLCWDRRADGDVGVRWLRQEIGRLTAAELQQLQASV